MKNNNLPFELQQILLEQSDEDILNMSYNEIKDWVLDNSLEEIDEYVKRYESMEYYEICEKIKRIIRQKPYNLGL
jgi:hypothetical protein